METVVTAQQLIYGYLIVTLSMLVSLFFAPTQVAALFKNKRVSFPVFTFLLIILFLFFQGTVVLP